MPDTNIEIRQKQKEVLERIRKRSVEIQKQNLLKHEEKELKIAVTEIGFDDMGSILEKLDYTYILIDDDEISDYEVLRKYNVLFINCGTGGDPDENKESLRKFVQKGGILYVSDLSAPQISTAFPGFIKFSSGGVVDQWINAKVTNQELREIIGSNIKIYFDMDNWTPIERVRNDVHIYLTGSFKTDYAYEENKPILVSFRYEEGEVIYTSFHNHQQATEEEEKLLKFFILKPVSIISKIPVISLAQSRGLIPIKQKG